MLKETAKVKISKGSKSSIYKVMLHENPNQVTTIDGFNARKDYGDMKQLIASMTENGQRVPASGYWDTENNVWVLTGGHRRLKAAQKIVEGGGEFVFLIQPEPRGYKEADRLTDMIIGNSGKQLNLMEEANVYARMSKLNLNEKEIAKKVGKSAVHVRNCFILLTADKATQKQIIKGEVAASTVIEMLRDMDAETVQNNIQKALKTTGKKKVTAKDIDGAKSGRERKAKTEKAPAKAATQESKADDTNDDSGKAATTKPAAKKKTKEATLDLNEVMDALEAAKTENGKLEWNMSSRRILVLLQNYAKGSVNWNEVEEAFLYTEE